MSWRECPRCTRMFTSEFGDPRECEACVQKEAEALAAVAETIEDHESLVEATVDRQIFAIDW